MKIRYANGWHKDTPDTKNRLSTMSGATRYHFVIPQYLKSLVESVKIGWMLIF